MRVDQGSPKGQVPQYKHQGPRIRRRKDRAIAGTGARFLSGLDVWPKLIIS